MEEGERFRRWRFGKDFTALSVSYNRGHETMKTSVVCIDAMGNKFRGEFLDDSEHLYYSNHRVWVLRPKLPKLVDETNRWIRTN